MEFLKGSIARFFHLDKMAEDVSGYVEAKTELVRLEFQKKMDDAIHRITLYAILGMSFLLMIIFVSLGIIHLINFLSGSSQLGYWIMAVLYLAIFLTLFFLKDSPKFNNFIRNLVKSKNDDPHK